MATVYRRGKQLDNAFHEVPAEKEERDQSTLGSSNRYPKAFNDISQTNTSTIASYIQSMKIEINLSDHYRKDIMILLCKFSKHNNNKLFRDLTRQEILAGIRSFSQVDWNVQLIQRISAKVLQMAILSLHRTV